MYIAIHLCFYRSCVVVRVVSVVVAVVVAVGYQ